MKNLIKNFLPSLTFSSLLLTFLTLFAGSVASAQIPSSGLVGYWPFNGNANDESGNGNNGTVNGATLTTDRFGSANSAYSFNGTTDFITSGLDTIPGNAYTISAWYNSNVAQSNEIGLVVSRTTWNVSTGLYLFNNTQYLQSTSTCDNFHYNGYSVNALNDSTWHHYVALYDGIQFKIYVDGELKSTTNSSIQMCIDANFKFGVDDLVPNRFFAGKVDDIAIYSRALNQEEILELFSNQGDSQILGCTDVSAINYNPGANTDDGSCISALTCNITTPTTATTLCAGQSATLTMNTTGGASSSSQLPANLQQGLVAYYPFNGNANDESGNGFNGTITGDLPFVTDRKGNANGAISFTGENCNTQVEALIDNTQISGQMTLSFWVNKQDPGCEGSRFFASYFSQVGILNNTNGHFQIIDNSTGFSVNHMVGSGVVAASDYGDILQQWTLITYSNDGQSGYFYKNGNLFATVPNNSGEVITLGNKIIFGHLGNSWVFGQTAFKGWMDDAVIWGRVLTAQEIQQLYSAQSYAWSTNETKPNITVSPTESTTYSCTVTQGNQTCTASVDITVNPAINNAVSATIVEGQSYIFGTQTLTTAGTYTEVFTSTTGCDSTVTLTLAVEPLLTCEITSNSTSVCSGEELILSMNSNAADIVNIGQSTFNGQGYIEFPNAGLIGSTSRTISYRAKTSSQNIMSVLNYGGAPNNGRGLVELGMNLNMWFGAGSGYCNSITKGVSFFSNSHSVNIGKTIFDNEWHTVTYVMGENNNFSFSSIKVYVDGILVSQGQNSTPFCGHNWGGWTYNTVDGPVTIGKPSSFNPYASKFVGSIADVGMWSRALTSAEVSNLNGQTPATIPLGLAHHYSFLGNAPVDLITGASGQVLGLTGSNIAWSTNATTPTVTVSPTANTTYTCTVTLGNQTCTASIDITVNPAINNAISATIIEGQSYTLGTQTLTTAGIYTEVFTSTAGCDSTVTLTLSVEPMLTCNITTPTATLCPGQSATLTMNTTGGAGASSQLPANLQQGLVAYYPFNGNANDESGNGNNGVVNGATLNTDRFGYQNSAYNFDGVNDFIQCSSTISTLNTATISGWAFCNSLFGGQFVHIGEDNNTNCNGIGVGKGGFNPLPGIGGGLNFWNLFQGSNLVSLVSCVNYYDSGQPLTNGTWFHYALLKQNNSFSYYINGTLVGTSPIGNALSPTNKIFIGCSGSGGPPNVRTYFSGQLDEVAIYNRALTNTEIQQLYTLGQTTYSWSNGSTTPSINVSPTETTTYTCTVSANGVSCTDSVTVVINNLSVNLGNDITTCDASTTIIGTAAGDSFLWNSGETSNSISVSSSGTYSCTVTQGECSATDSIDVTLIDATITASDTDICAGETVTLSVPQISGSNIIPNSTLPQNLQVGLVGYWPFNGNANDESGNGYNGNTVNANSVEDRFGDISALHFGNTFDSRVSVNIGTPIQVSEKTFSIWFKYPLYALNDYPHLMMQDPGIELSTYEYIHVLGSIYGENSGRLGSTLGTPTSYINDNQWHHLALSINYLSGVGSIYIDGDLQFENYNQVVPIPIASFVIGNRFSDWHPGWRFTGDLDDLAIYSRALSSAEIQQLYSLGQPTYLWSTGALTPSLNVNPTATTTYTCTVTENGVSCTDSVTVEVNNIRFNLGPDSTICGTETILLAPAGMDSYVWNTGEITSSILVSASGTYSCTLTKENCSETNAINIVLIDASISSSDSEICLGQSTTLSVDEVISSNSTLNSILPTNLQEGLVGYWPFNGNANDESGNGYDGTPINVNVVADRFGNLSAYHFGDTFDSRVEVDINAPIEISEKTFSIWFKYSTNLDNDYPHLMMQGPSTESDLTEYTHILGPIYGSSAGRLGASSLGSTASFINDNQWHHLALVRNYSTGFGSIYLDGNLESESYSQVVPIPIASFTIGNVLADWNYGSRYSGDLDDVAIYNRALSSTEIQQLYNQEETRYTWSTGATTPTINVSPATTTTYTCTITTNGVSCTDSVTVVVSQPAASITPNGIVEICEGESIALTANGGVSYLWNTGAPTQSITVNTEAVYSVTVTDANGCTDTESQLVKVNQLPNIGVSNASICSGQSTTLTATGGLSYVWFPATGLSSTTGTTVTASPSTSIVYTLTGTGANGCTNTATAAVAVNAALTATITPASSTTFCQGGSVVLNANTGTGLTYQWRLNGNPISGASSSSYTANVGGSYSVVVSSESICPSASLPTIVTVLSPSNTVETISACQSYDWKGQTYTTSGTYTHNATSLEGCPFTEFLMLTIETGSPTTPTAITGESYMCDYLTGVTTTYSTPAVAGVTYEWVAPAGMTIVSGQGTNTITVSFSNAFVTSPLKVRAVNACGRSAYKFFSVKRKAPAVPRSLTTSSAKACPGDTRVFTATAMPGATSYNWTAPSGASVTSGQGTNIATITFNSDFTTPGVVSVTAANSCGTSLSKTKTINLNTPLRPGLITGTRTVTQNQTAVPYSVVNVGGMTYNWTVASNFGSISSGQGSNAITVNATNNIGTGYTMSVTASNGCGTSPVRAIANLKIIAGLSALELSETASSDLEKADVSKLAALSVYPNPSSDMVTLQLRNIEEGTVSQITIFDLTGKQVLSMQSTSNLQLIDVSGFAKGMYILHVNTNQENFVEKLQVR